MKAKIQTIFTVLALAGTINAQSINVTPTGVGIGTPTPTQKLDVAGNVAATGNITAGGTLTTGGSVSVGSSLSTVGSLSAGNGVGGPQGNFEIYTYTDANATPLISLRSRYDGAGKYGMIRFGDASQTFNYQKGAIIYESTTSVGRGRMHLALENTDGAGSVALSDAKLTVLSNGDVGIGTTSPGVKLDVNGSVNASGNITAGGTLSAVGQISSPQVCKAWVNFCGVPLAGTYVRSGNVVTVTMAAHGMTTGQIANLSFTSGTATSAPGYVVTFINANSFSVTDAVSGATSGNVTRNTYIRASFNVASVVRNGAGDYTLNFGTQMSSANYCVICTCERYPTGTSGPSSAAGLNLATLPSTGSVRVGIQAPMATPQDAMYFCVSILSN